MGQELSADPLLSSSEVEVSIALPSICLMEAISAFDWKRIERNRLKDELDRQLRQLLRSTDIPTAKQLAAELTQADLTNERLLSELFQRLDDYLSRVARRAELIPISSDVVDHGVRLVREAELDRDDALILASILAHSQNSASINKAFLTGNIKDFEKDSVKALLADAGIKQFRSTHNALGWALAQH